MPILSRIKRFFEQLYKAIKAQVSTRTGLISLIVSFSLVVGWALVLVAIGTITGDAWCLAIGSTVIAFWSLPVISPMWGLIFVIAALLKKALDRVSHRRKQQ